MSDPECVMCGGSWQRTHIELLRVEVELLRSRLSARDAEVRALRGFARHSTECAQGRYGDAAYPCTCGLSALLTGAPVPGGRDE